MESSGSLNQVKTFTRLNPIDGSVASEAPAFSVEQALTAADAAHTALGVWSEMGPNARRVILNKAADELAARAGDFVSAMSREIGATEGWARFNVGLAVGMVREAASLTTQIGGEVIPSDKPGCLSMALRVPAGVVLGIAPWNAPVILGVRAIATALACGNTVVFKTSEICPHTHGLIAEAFQAAGFPSGAVSVVSNAPQDAGDIVAALIGHPAIRRINFTGSTRIGRIIARLAAEHLKPALLELGGKAPLVILDDADLDEAVKAAAFGAFMNQGQICMSTERIIVVDAVAGEFVSRFTAKAKTMLAGDPAAGTTPLGALVDAGAAKRVQSLIDDAVSKGARHVVQGAASGVVMSANVVDGVTKDMEIYAEESFGPVVAIIHARDEEHAITLSNDSEYGLSASVFTRDIARGLRVVKRIHSGIAHINGPTVHDEAQMPFGGMKGSGYGRFGGKAGIDAFTETRWVTIETQPGHYPI